MDHALPTPRRPMADGRDADVAATAVTGGPLQRHHEDRVVGESLETGAEVVANDVGCERAGGR